MSTTVTCNKCGKQADGHGNNGFSHLTFSVRVGDQYGTVDIDLCPEDTNTMTQLILEWIDKKEE